MLSSHVQKIFSFCRCHIFFKAVPFLPHYFYLTILFLCFCWYSIGIDKTAQPPRVWGVTKRLNHHRCSVFLSSKKYLLGFCACLILHFYVLVLPITHYSLILNLLLSFEKVNIHLSLALLTLSPFIGLLLPFISFPFSNFVSIPKSYQEVILVPAYNRLWMKKMQALVS